MRRTISLFLTLLACAALTAQTTKAPRAGAQRAPQAGELRKTPDGQPDLQGVWNFSTITPLERSAEFAGREFMTDAEAARFEARIAQQSNRDNRGDNAGRRRGERLQRILVGPRQPRRARERQGADLAHR